MANKRDSKNRILNKGEGQRADGRYYYTYTGIDGKRRTIYSWKLVETDKVHNGKKCDKALRTLVAEINKKVSQRLNLDGGSITVGELVDVYLKTKQNAIKPQTLAQYKVNIKLLRIQSFGDRKVKDVKCIDAENFFIELNNMGYSSGTIANLKCVLSPCFAKATRDRIIEFNPFDFKLNTIITPNKKVRNAITEAEKEKFLKFVQNNRCFKKHYDLALLLFNTGVRVGELCGLTMDDIDLENKTITISRQMTTNKKIAPPKSKSGNRTIPISDETCSAVRRMIGYTMFKHTNQPTVDGVTNFLILNNRGNVMTDALVENTFCNMVRAFNKKTGLGLEITPHVCRHTFCSILIQRGVSPKIVSYLMGHSTVAITLDVYTHINHEAVREDMVRCGVV